MSGANVSGGLTHIDSRGQARMVDVGGKDQTERVAVARGRVKMKPATASLIAEGGAAKGDVLGVARVAGIMAAKRVGELIPLCHPIAVTSVKVDLEVNEEAGFVDIQSRVQTVGQTGVEMEALTSVSVAALTIYDMCKAVDKDMVITDVRLIEKSGGRSGHYLRPDEGESPAVVWQPPVISFVGFSGSGKTTLLEKVISILVARGHRVGVIKHDAHDFEMDYPGKDTWRHYQAGARSVAISSPVKFAVVSRTDGEMPLNRIAEMFPDTDVILTEGYKTGDKPKVVVYRSERGGEIPCLGDPQVLAYASDVPLEVERPVYDLNDAEGLATLVEGVLSKGLSG